MAEIKNIRIAISGIYDYAQEELASLRLDLPGTGKAKGVQEKRVYQVYRPSLVLERAKDKFKLLPLTHHHPQKPVDGKNFRKLAVGYTGENTYIDFLSDKNEVGIRSNLVLYDDESLEAYNRGEIQLSPGYVGLFEWKQGVSPNGQAYDIIMQEIETVNHLALLPAGRGGAEAIILDKSIETHKTVFELASERLQAFDGDFKEDLHKRDKGGKFATSSEGKEKSSYNEREKEYKKNINSWATQQNYDEAKKMSKKEIFEKFGKENKPIAEFDKKFLSFFEKTKDTKIYCSKGYFIDHMVNHHPDIPVSEYEKIPNTIKNYDKVKVDDTKGRATLIFMKKEKKWNVTVIAQEKSGKIVIHKTFFQTKKETYKSKKELEVLPSDGSPEIMHTEKTAYASNRNISALDNTSTDTIPDNAPKVNTIFSLINNILYIRLVVNLIKNFDILGIKTEVTTQEIFDVIQETRELL